MFIVLSLIILVTISRKVECQTDSPVVLVESKEGVMLFGFFAPWPKEFLTNYNTVECKKLYAEYYRESYNIFLKKCMKHPWTWKIRVYSEPHESSRVLGYIIITSGNRQPEDTYFYWLPQSETEIKHEQCMSKIKQALKKTIKDSMNPQGRIVNLKEIKVDCKGFKSFRLDNYNGDFHYEIYTYLEKKGDWVKLPSDPFPSAVWINIKNSGLISEFYPVRKGMEPEPYLLVENTKIFLVDQGRLKPIKLKGYRKWIKILKTEDDLMYFTKEVTRRYAPHPDSTPCPAKKDSDSKSGLCLKDGYKTYAIHVKDLFKKNGHLKLGVDLECCLVER